MITPLSPICASARFVPTHQFFAFLKRHLHCCPHFALGSSEAPFERFWCERKSLSSTYSRTGRLAGSLKLAEQQLSFYSSLGRISLFFWDNRRGNFILILSKFCGRTCLLGAKPSLCLPSSRCAEALSTTAAATLPVIFSHRSQPRSFCLAFVYGNRWTDGETK